jgi:hypothetical protein
MLRVALAQQATACFFEQFSPRFRPLAIGDHLKKQS